MWIYSWPLMAGGIFNWGFFASQRWALELFVSTSEVGKFFALTQVVATPITLAGGLIITLISPILFSRVGNLSTSEKVVNSKKVVVKLAVSGMVIVFLLSLMSSFFSERILKLFVAREYIDVAKYMPIVIISSGVLQCSQVLGIVLTIAMQTKKVLPLAIFGQSLFVLFNLVFVWQFGINGLFYSMVLGSFLHLIWMIIIVKNVK
jgi:O-antigen/teichoic acid export membrane protein